MPNQKAKGFQRHLGSYHTAEDAARCYGASPVWRLRVSNTLQRVSRVAACVSQTPYTAPLVSRLTASINPTLPLAPSTYPPLLHPAVMLQTVQLSAFAARLPS